MPPTQQEINQFVSNVRSDRAQARSIFGADDAEVKGHSDEDVLIELRFDPADSTDAAKHTAEQSAIDTADDLRGWGARVNLRSRDGTATVFATFAP